MNPIDAAFVQGMIDHACGKYLTNNPFNSDTEKELSDAWHRGFEQYRYTH